MYTKDQAHQDTVDTLMSMYEENLLQVLGMIRSRANRGLYKLVYTILSDKETDFIEDLEMKADGIAYLLCNLGYTVNIISSPTFIQLHISW